MLMTATFVRGVIGRHRRRGEAGFTLIELLVTVVILSVITVPLADVLVSALRNTGTTSDRLDVSHDAQISSSYFARDVAAVGIRDYDNIAANSVAFKQSVQLNAAYDAGGHTCGDTSTPVAAIRLFADAWDATQNPAVQNTDTIAYYLKSAGAVAELHRIKCAGPSTTPASDVVLAHNVKPGSVTVTCSSDCESANVPEQITLSLVATKPSVGDYPITLNGQRRQS